MKYLFQLLIILIFTYVAEAAVQVFAIPFPGSVLGMLALFAAMKLGWIKPESVRGAGDYLLSVLPVMFVPLGVGIMKYGDILVGQLTSLILILAVTTVLVMAVTGRMVQWIMRRGERNNG